MKDSRTLLVTREMQITDTCHSPPTRMVIIIKIDHERDWQECGEIGTLIFSEFLPRRQWRVAQGTGPLHPATRETEKELLALSFGSAQIKTVKWCSNEPGNTLAVPQHAKQKVVMSNNATPQ